MFRFDFRGARGAVAAWAVASALSSTAHAVQPERHAADHGHAHAAQVLTAKDFRNAPRDLVLWGELAKVGVTRKSGRYHVTFLPPVLALDGKTVALVGFMTTVRPGDRHTQFLLSNRPICEECHGAPNLYGIVEVN